MRSVSIRKQKRHLVFLGAGHAHLNAWPHVMAWALEQGHEVTVVSDAENLWYSGMMPGWVARQYTLPQCLIPVRALASSLGARWVQAKVNGINPKDKTWQGTGNSGEHLSGTYDLLSINVGSETLEHQVAGGQLAVKPFAQFAMGLEALDKERPNALTVLGSGAAGVELAFALKARWPACHLLVRGLEPAPLLSRGSIASRLVAREFQRLGIGFEMLKTEHAPKDELLVAATGPRTPAWLSTALPEACGDKGLIVSQCFQLVKHSDIFAAGDCANLSVPKSGVYALKQGAALGANLKLALMGQQATVAYKPAAQSLALLNVCDGSAIASWGPIAAKGQLAWRLKDQIDTGFVNKHQAKRLA